jgi:hypothetical protein
VRQRAVLRFVVLSLATRRKGDNGTKSATIVNKFYIIISLDVVFYLAKMVLLSENRLMKKISYLFIN